MKEDTFKEDIIGYLKRGESSVEETFIEYDVSIYYIAKA